MVMDNGGRIYLLTTLTTRAPADIICCASQMDYNTITDYLKRNRIGFVRISEEDATKLVHTNGGIGTGCYIPDLYGVTNEHRRASALCNYNDLSAIVGVITNSEPVVLPIESVLREREMALAS